MLSWGDILGLGSPLETKFYFSF